MNALAALAAANAVGVDIASVLPALADFRSVKRRMEVIGAARRHHRLRRFRPPSDRDRDHARRLAREGRRRAHRGGDGAAQQFDAPGRACRRAGAVAGCDADVVVFLQRPELAWDAGKVDRGAARRRRRGRPTSMR